MKLNFCLRCLLLVVIISSITNAEHRVKKDIHLIKDIILTKIFGNQNESKLKPIFVQDNFYTGSEGLLSVGKEEIKIKIPKESEEPYKPEYTYKQIRNDGSAIIYTLNDNDEVIVSDTRNQQNPLDSSEYIRNKPAFSSFQARLKPSIPCKPNPLYLPFNPLRQMYSMPPVRKNPDYSYKVIHKDGSVSTYFGTGEVQEQQLRDPTSNIDRFIPNSQPYVMNRLQNLAGSPFLPGRRNVVYREEIEPIEVIDGENQLPPYILPQNEPASNLVPDEVVYLPQPSYNIPVRMTPLSNVYDQDNVKHEDQEVEDVFVETIVAPSAENTAEVEESISDKANQMADSNIINVTTPETTASAENVSEQEVISIPSSKTEKPTVSEVTTVKMSLKTDKENKGTFANANGKTLITTRGDIPN